MQSKKIDFEIIKGYNIFVEKEKVRYRDTQRPKETFFLWTSRESKGNQDNWQKMTKRRKKCFLFVYYYFNTWEFYDFGILLTSIEKNVAFAIYRKWGKTWTEAINTLSTHFFFAETFPFCYQPGLLTLNNSRKNVKDWWKLFSRFFTPTKEVSSKNSRCYKNKN